MADITGYVSGDVNDSGKVNWRGDQATAPVGQSIYKSSSVPLAELGARVVVGDRVFRYSRAAGTMQAGDLAQMNAVSLINVTAGATNPAGGKIFTFYFATSNAADVYTEGTLIAQSGTATNMGFTYRIKSQPIVATTANADLVLYDPLVREINVTDKYSVFQNPYRGLTQCTAGTAPAMGVTPISIVSSDYFWLQTWGPCAAKVAAVSLGAPILAQNTGQVLGLTGTDGGGVKTQVGYSLQLATASERGFVFLTLAP